MRIALVRRTVLGGLAVVVVSLAGAIAATGSPPGRFPRAFYLVEPDPRCARRLRSLCGGYWVSLANREPSRAAHDGAFARPLRWQSCPPSPGHERVAPSLALEDGRATV